MGQRELPQWLTQSAPYDPPADRDGYLRRNVLRLAQTLEVFRAETPAASSAVDRLLARVPAPLRLLGVVLLVALVAAARNMALVWLVLAVALCLLALRPPQTIRAVLVPALAVALLSALVNLPAALFLGQTEAPLRVATKAFVTLLLVCGLSRSVAAEELLGGFAALGLPPTFTLTLDLAVRDLALLGAEATTLSEALELRSVGHNHSKTASAAGVLGMVFLRAQRHATAQAEAMVLRGYPGASGSRRVRPSVAMLLYLLLLALAVGAFVYLEAAL